MPTRLPGQLQYGPHSRLKRRSAFERGVAALRQYVEREQRVVVPRGHEERLPDGRTVRLGVWLSNAKSRREGLEEAQLAELAGLGLPWAAVVV
ncbi:helicase associated domain-containing protein [Kitasatospora sp. NPDC056181]|uniref:helicase associated domain-containing protein n=1 Tax=Kitasatospora sp. NPDC056181 TaxID=3345737 RepID=UPI0035D771CB